MITTEANPLMARIRNTKQRMPAILLPGAESIWLQSDVNDALLKGISKPLDQTIMEVFTISRLISNPKVNSNVSEVMKSGVYPKLSQQQLQLF